MHDWDDLRVFLAIVEQGGLKKAAASLGIHHTSCARRLAKLEAEMGVNLFDRLPSGYAPTEAGDDLRKSVSIIRDEVNAINLKLKGQDARLEGPIRLTLPNGFATHFLMPSLRAFMEEYPLVQLEIHMTYAFSDLEQREADVAVRHISEPPQRLYGRSLGKLFRSAYASESYLETHDPIDRPEECHWMGWGNADQHMSWPQKSKFPTIPVRGNMYSDVLQLAAVQADAGIASLPCFIGDTAAGVRRIPSAEAEMTDHIWALCSRSMARNSRVRALMQHLLDTFTRLKPLLDGSGYVH